MSGEIDQLLVLIANILQPQDKQLRESAEGNLVGLRESNPNELMIAFLNILEGSYKAQYRTFSVTQIRLCLSTFSPSTYTNLWDKLTPDNQNLFKTKLFQILYSESADSMKKLIADAIGQIAGSIISVEPQKWPELRQNLWTLFKDQNLTSVMSGFFVLESFFPFSHEFFDGIESELDALFKSGFNHENCKLKSSALKAFRSYLQIIEVKDHKRLKPLIMDILKAVYEILTKDNMNEEGLQTLSEMLEIDGKFFKSNFKELNLLLQNIFKIPKIESGIKRMATEMLVCYSEKYPSIFRKNKDYLNSLLEMVFIHMIDIEPEINDRWKSPEEGYSEDMEDDENFETTRFGMNAIDRIILSVGDKEVLPLLSNSIKKLLHEEDWRCKYSAVMALSQIGEYIEQVSHISSIVDMITGFLSHPNPMLRYASCHAIGQISDDMQLKFQELYGDVLFPKLVDLLSDPIPRVISHSASCLANFLVGIEIQTVSPLLDKMMELLIHHATSGISLVKQSSLNAISSVAELTKNDFEKYVEVTGSLLFQIFQTHTKKQYKQLRGQSIETLTIIASAIGAEKFRPALDKLVNIMISIQESTFEQTDPQKTYILSGWQRLCVEYGRELEIYLNRILPSLFALVQNVINNEIQLVNNPKFQGQNEESRKKSKKKNINTFETEQAEVAIAMINVFIDQLKELYHPYVQETVSLLCKIIAEHVNVDVREQACKCLPSLVSAMKSTNPQTAIDLTKYFMNTLVITIEKELDPEVIFIEVETLKGVIEDLDMCFLNEEEISHFFGKILTILKKSEDTKQATKKMKKTREEYYDQQEKKYIEDEINEEEELQVAVTEVIGMLFKTHQDLSMPIAQYFINNILPDVFKAGHSDIKYKFGLFLIDDLVEYLGYERVGEHWSHFSNTLLSFTKAQHCEVRQAACYGLGVLAERTPSDSLAPETVEEWLQALVSASKIEKNYIEKQKSYGDCRDNAISSIGKIIKAHGAKVNARSYLQYWITFLPLRFDKPQALIQHKFLLNIMQNNPTVLIGDDEPSQVAGLQKVLSVYGNILVNGKIYNDEIKKQMKAHVLSLQNVPVFMAHRDQIWNQLSQREKQNITALLK